jgi:RNA polymerase sigma-70 factor (ECF subfamily)
MADGPQAGLGLVDALVEAGELREYHLLYAVRADLLRRLGRADEAASSYRRAIELAPTAGERAHLERRLAELSS